LQHPIAADHFPGFDRRAVRNAGLASGKRQARAGRQRLQPIERNERAGFLQFLVELAHLRHHLRIRRKMWIRLLAVFRLIYRWDHEYQESHTLSPLFEFPIFT
jgi:hypothetical protein